MQLDFSFLKNKGKIAVATSGGADSLALTLLLNDYCQNEKIDLTALTIDHKLRPESTIEADFVHTILTSKGIKHHTLTWIGKKPKTAIEEIAREKRYSLLYEYCQKHQISVLCLGHTINDQAETFLMRLARGSGIDGLSAMSPVSYYMDLCLYRPLLKQSHEDLKKLLKTKYKQTWVEDPSNEDLTYERVRIRKAFSNLNQLGLFPSMLSKSAERIYRAKQTLTSYSNDIENKIFQRTTANFAFCNIKDWENLMPEFKIRILSNIIQEISKTNPELSQLEKYISSDLKCITLSGCQIIKTKKKLFIIREEAKIPPPLTIKPNTWTLFDHLFILTDQKIVVKCLASDLRVKNLPAKVCRIIPAFYDTSGTLIAVPFLNYYTKPIHIEIKTKE